jgi:adenosine deaminase
MIHNDLPLIDLHRHLDGNVRLSTILDLGKKHGLNLPGNTVESLRPYIQVKKPLEDINEYFQKFTWMVSVFADYDACRRVAYENVMDAQNEGIDYIELRFSPWFMAEPHGLEPAGVVEAVIQGLREGAQDAQGIKANLIGIISRTYGVEVGFKELNALLAYKEDIVGLDLAGDEANYPAEWFVAHFNKARDAGWGITAHAGESVGPQSVWHAIKDLGASRIGHAVRILEDPSLVDYMREHRIGIESNLTSNVHTNTVPSYQAHPLKRFLDLGLLATINTDDPGISPVTIADEFSAAVNYAGLTDEDTRQAQKNALEIAFLSEDEKDLLLRKKIGSGGSR